MDDIGALDRQGVSSRATSALMHLRRGPAVLEDRGEDFVLAQRH